MKTLKDINGVEIKVGDKVEFSQPVAYIGGEFPKPIVGTIIEEDGELVHYDGSRKIPIKNFKSFSWLVI